MTRHLRQILIVLMLAAALPRAACAQTTDALLDTLQHTGVLYFWNEANPTNGLIKDRSSASNFCSIAANGFGFSALIIGVERGWLDKNAVRTRTLTTLQTFWNGPQGTASTGTIGYKGFFYHFLNMDTATRYGTDVELSTIDTALLFAGILDAKHYWNTSIPEDVEIRALADSITWRADWNFMRNFNPGVYMGWKPGTQFGGYGPWVGYNEAMILYILALGSPTHAVAPNAWTKWTSNYNYGLYYGYEFLTCPPLFTHQYSHCWVDFRGIWDTYMQGKGSNYFENSVRATLAQRAYCIDNPGNFVGYSDSLWGLTAGDDPDFGYIARGAPPALNDNGTISPTAGISSIPFTPTESLQLIRNLWNNWRATTWGPYGFKDAFRPQDGWVDQDFLGIDQGPIVLMIENYRTGQVWNRMMQDDQIQTGLTRAGFTIQPSTGVGDAGVSGGIALRGVVPNPATVSTTVRYSLPRAAFATLEVFDARGRRVLSPISGEQTAGEHAQTVKTDGLSPGLYWLRLSTPYGAATTRFTRVH